MNINQVAGLIFAVVLAVALTFFGLDYRAAKQGAAQNENRGMVMVATDETLRDGAVADTQRDRIDHVVVQAGQTFDQSMQEAYQNEPETRTRGDRPVPDSVRNAYRERRRARERLGCAGGECRQDDAPDVTP